MAVAEAFLALKTICLLFGLHTDDDNTYAWGITKRSREGVSQLGFECLTDARELGGAMTFGGAGRNRVLPERGQRDSEEAG